VPDRGTAKGFGIVYRCCGGPLGLFCWPYAEAVAGDRAGFGADHDPSNDSAVQEASPAAGEAVFLVVMIAAMGGPARIPSPRELVDAGFLPEFASPSSAKCPQPKPVM